MAVVVDAYIAVVAWIAFVPIDSVADRASAAVAVVPKAMVLALANDSCDYWHTTESVAVAVVVV